MINVDHYVKHHKDLMDIASQILNRLEPDSLKRDASEIRSLLSSLAGKLKMHLAMEDDALYPRLLKHSDNKVREVAQKFTDEMGQIYDEFGNYLKRWPNPVAIEKDPAGFIKETKAIFSALSERIKKEDAELYTLVN